MPSNPDKRHCSVTGCKAWAIHGTDPPLCSPHARRGGAPPGNANRLLHGLYAASPHPEEESGDPDQAVATSLDGEIRETRAIYHRLVQMIATGVTPGPDPQSLTATEYIRLIGLAFAGAGTISRLVRVRAALPDRMDEFDKMMRGVLTDLGEELGAKLVE